MERYLCIHAHFYQPPRENPWLEEIERQDSAYPYHDWNERITAECYAPNSAARILDAQGRITKILNVYSKISFNFGPTLLSYLEHQQPDVYQSIIRADEDSRRRFSGHGGALAQTYNHIILPLASRRDKETQIRWGIRDFEHRYGRRPEGMWLAETAVDLESLEILAAEGIRFTVLAPSQAARIREIGTETWSDVSGGKIDPTRAYRSRLPSGEEIGLFFYDGPISQAIAFERLLTRGEHLVGRLEGAFSRGRDWPQLVHIATDGETYGHHHRYGEMALAYALDSVEKRSDVRLTVYGEYLEKSPPTHEVEVFENSSWSCVHGIERWRADCGCNSGGRPEWTQSWRQPLRSALDWLRDTLEPSYEEAAGALLKDPWVARDDYIAVILNRSSSLVDNFLARHAARALSDAEKSRCLMLLELQRNAMLMYTSCGWFFDDLAGIETIQVIQYAGRTLQLASILFPGRTEEQFLERLSEACSNVKEQGTGRHIYERYVRPSVVDLSKVAAQYAIESLFEPEARSRSIYCYDVAVSEAKMFASARAKFYVGRARVTSRITRATADLCYGALQLGEHNVNVGVRKFGSRDTTEALYEDAAEAVKAADFPELIRNLDKQFGSATYSLKTLFRDAQWDVTNRILQSTLHEVEVEYEQLYERRVPLMRFFGELGMKLPRPLRLAAETVLNAKLRRELEREELDAERVEELLEDARSENVSLDGPGLSYAFQGLLEKKALALLRATSDLDRIVALKEAVSLGLSSPFEVNLWRVQNLYYKLLEEVYPPAIKQIEQGDLTGRTWLLAFEALGEKLAVHVPQRSVASD